MIRFATATLLAACCLPGAPVFANMGPAFLPELTFPEPAPQPKVSTQGCTTPTRCR